LLRKEIGDWRGRADTFWGSAINYEALKNRVTLFLEVPLMKPKNCLDLRTNNRPEFLAGPKLAFHRSLLFSLPTRSIEEKILIQFFDARSASSYQVILFFAILFEHQFNNFNRVQ
jgi:hypothetical protein